ncbi:cytochrome c oxidase assembly protein [Deltaproteobacteria bacterium]|nr:cytochrome c oxidase assembly protein [Deltaproteobacteria bacterium]
MLETIWFVLWGLLWAIYFILDGFDFGLGMMLPVVAENDTERRIMYNAAGPFWDGNEVWLITAGGVTFAAFPTAYAVMFSALYAPLLILLFALIIRAVSFEFRNKVDCKCWRKAWDTCHIIGNFVPALLLGVAFGNLFLGIPIDGDGVYHGNILKLLNPYALVAGIVFILMFCMHGMLWLAVKSATVLHERSVAYAKGIWWAVAGTSVLFLIMTYTYTSLWDNYLAMPLLLALPLLAIICLLGTRIMMARGKMVYAWAASAGFIGFVTLFGVVGMFPKLIPSSLDPSFSVTIQNGASSPFTLTVMLIVALVMVPVVIGYQTWVFLTFSHKLTEEELASPAAYY